MNKSVALSILTFIAMGIIVVLVSSSYVNNVQLGIIIAISCMLILGYLNCQSLKDSIKQKRKFASIVEIIQLAIIIILVAEVIKHIL